jgi:hypothetical protein
MHIRNDSHVCWYIPQNDEGQTQKDARRWFSTTLTFEYASTLNE